MAPTATHTPVVLPTSTPLPRQTDTPEVDEAAAGFSDLLACLEDRLGPEVAQTLLSGERQETPAEKVVVQGCLLVSASGVSTQDLTPAVTACLEEALGAGVVTIVSSGARSFTADEETVLLDCLVTSALAPPEPEPVSSLDACLEEHLGAEIAALVASGSVPLDEADQAILDECRIASALSPSEEAPEASVTACLQEKLGVEVAAVVASGLVPLTEEEATVLGDCLVQEGLEESAPTQEQTLIACLTERLGAEIAAVVASGFFPLDDDEQEVLGECLLSSSLDTSSESVSQSVIACLEERLGPEIAAVVASGAILPTEEEAEILGDCLLQAALGG